MEDKKNETIIDWVNLPTGTKIESLWCSLHDAVLRSVRSNLLERTVAFDFEIFYIQEHHNLQNDVSFIFTLKGVTSVRANTFAVWPGIFTMPPNISRVEQEKLVKEYQSKWREESISWNDFESVIGSKIATFVVSNSELALKNDNLALYIDGHLNNDKYYSVFLRADKLLIQQSDGKPLTLEQFRKLGEEYWEAF